MRQSLRIEMPFNRADLYDAELRRYNEHFRAALKLDAADRVLDIGCGAGQSSREAARVAVNGRVVGIDISEEMLEVARQRSAEQGLRNISFLRGDAQVMDLPADHFDLCISRFGSMFFAEPVAAFANIGAAMRPGARLVLLVWQSRECNEWATAIQQTLFDEAAPPQSPATFSLADPAVTTTVLTTAGFESIEFAEVHEPVFYGSTLDAAYAAAVQLFLPVEASAEVHQRLRALLAAHVTTDGVLFDSRAWIVTARRPRPAG